jgi:preprotein translocase subunit SecA
MKKYLSEIKFESSSLVLKTDDELFLKVESIKKKYKTYCSGIGTRTDEILIEWFALVQEISFRKIGLRHFETQLCAGLFLHQGKIVELKTGEGKTLASTLPISLNALTQKGVHVVTVNDYLAERDKNWMGKIYESLGLSVGLVKSNSEIDEKKKSYQKDITYVTNSELVFDYLRDSSAFEINDIVQRPFNYCILDEIDSILIDEARTPLILSTIEGDINKKKLYLAKIIVSTLENKIHFEIDEKRKDINLTEKGYHDIKERLGKKSLYEVEDPWILEILNALKAKHLFKLNKDYIVLKNKILIIDEFTGRIMEDRRWSLGIHEAIEMKENVEIGGTSKTKSSITYQNFFTLYPKLAGMTGTGKTAEKEFKDIYNLEVVVVNTSKPMIRKDYSDLVYQTELTKWKAVLEKSKECFNTGQPILIGTASVEKSEFLSELFKISKIPHQVLNAKPENIVRESQIIAQAGEPYAVTIATNMAGRGTDIILGGNPVFEVKNRLRELLSPNGPMSSISSISFLNNELIQEVFKDYNLIQPTERREEIEIKNERKLYLEKEINYSSLPKKKKGPKGEDIEKNNSSSISSIKEIKEINKDIENIPYSLDTCRSSLKNLYNYLYKEIYEKWEIKNKFVKDLGGLFVLGTERHETRRIDNQLRGRAGRQGDPGISQFFVSLDDQLIQIFAGDSIRRWLDYLLQDKDVPLESKSLTESLEKAQEKVELYNYDIRKNVFQYDQILNLQRKKLFEIRNQILSNNMYNLLSFSYAEACFDEIFLNTNKIWGKKSILERENRASEFDSFSLFLKNDSFNLFKKLDYFFGNYSSYSFKKTMEIEKSKKALAEKKVDFERRENRENLLFLNKYFYNEIWISNDLRFAQSNLYQLGFLKNTQNTNILNIIDFYWTEHLERMNYIRETINWRSYGQQNPLIEYNLEAFDSYYGMLKEIRWSMLYYFLENPILNN